MRASATTESRKCETITGDQKVSVGCNPNHMRNHC